MTTLFSLPFYWTTGQGCGPSCLQSQLDQSLKFPSVLSLCRFICGFRTQLVCRRITKHQLLQLGRWFRYSRSYCSFSF